MVAPVAPSAGTARSRTLNLVWFLVSHMDTEGRNDPLAEVDEDTPVLLFDGVCNLCNGVVQFIIRNDPDAEFRFAALQSEAGQALLERFDLPTDDFDSFVLVENGEYVTKSTAAILIAKRLGFPFSLLYPFIVLPKSLRDRVYDLVADNRYRIFGRKEQCMVPTPDRQARFLD